MPVIPHNKCPMNGLFHVLTVMLLTAAGALAAEPAPRLAPGRTLSVQFPQMPPTFCALPSAWGGSRCLPFLARSW